MARSITVIPARTNGTNLAHTIEPQKKKMAAYCRVSTDQLEQLSSYEAQVNYYTNYINSSEEYEFAGIFADEGISGTNTKKREQFNKMIEDCNAGKIDMIITKSISRFARNTLDCLNFVRQLKELGVGIIFEKENINTLDAKGEVLLTILSSLAQDESRSISENSTWGIRRRFEQGKLHINHKKFLGYDKDEECNLIINEKQAKIVRRIYKEYLDGKGTNRIAKEFEAEGIPKWDGNTNWYEGSIRKMLSNEKYKGDALLQKTYTVDFLTKKRTKNNGEVPKYYVEESHPAIIDKDMWEAVQLEMERRKAFTERYGISKIDYATVTNPFAGRVICGCCGSVLGRKVWNSTDEKFRKKVWVCSKKYAVKGKKGCESKHTEDKVLYQAFVNTFNAMVENKEFFMEKWKAVLNSENVLVKYKAKQFIRIMEKSKEIKGFDVDLFFKIIEKMTVFDGKKVIVTLLDGTEIECEIE
ncbi:recombinase family protein [Clostridium grantii]|uniref:Site-specific DNA recombinase n=1 Tax=Clostridium grantii DSM 8605 TaxID=1121316 RepID=A0A1M5SN94_9CLOT|nr:recombinase family protein [Clostridium grantii]SHH39920.1 Site-specific DNA recombinase [Clostridium grantii DSM 8605]